MPLFQVLSHYGADRLRWQQLLARLHPYPDVHWTPQYAELEELRGGTALMLALEHAGAVVMQPIVLHRSERLGAERVLDITSPYGHGGPLAAGGDAGTYALFNAMVLDWANRRKLVSEFCSLHPLMFDDQATILRGAGIKIEQRKPVVYVSLLLPAAYRKDRRQGIARAIREGVTVVQAEPAVNENRRAFVRLYRETMLRKEASSRWWFSDEYLHGLCLLPGSRLFFAVVNGEVEVATVVLSSRFVAHYHLTGNAMRNPKSRANDLLIHTVVEWARDMDKTRLYLGGGATDAPDDSLLAYKMGFSPFIAGCHTYFRVFDPARYEALCKRKKDFERVTLGAEINTTFQPRFRADVAA